MDESSHPQRAQAGLEIRSDLRSAHSRAWERLGRAGTWWTAEQRVAIAAEVRSARRCAFCVERRAAATPLSRLGTHDSTGPLDETVVEVVHRLVTDSGRLSHAWFDSIRAAGLKETHYIETVGVVVTVLSVDTFCRGLGVPLTPLPQPADGEPSRYRPDGASKDTGWVAMLTGSSAVGSEADLFPDGRAPNVIRALSLVPDEVRGLKELSAAQYVPLKALFDLRAGRAIDRSQIELLAGRVSALNECFY